MGDLTIIMLPINHHFIVTNVKYISQERGVDTKFK